MPPKVKVVELVQQDILKADDIMHHGVGGTVASSLPHYSMVLHCVASPGAANVVQEELRGNCVDGQGERKAL